MQDLLTNPVVASLLVGGAGAASVHLVVVLIKVLLGKLKEKAAKTPSPLDDAALNAVETVLDSTAPLLEKTLGKK